KTAKAIIDLVRTRRPGARIVVGGYDPSLAPEAYTEDPAGGVDFIVRGEGEITFRELLRALETQRGYDHIAGLSYRSADGFRHNLARDVSGLEDGEIRPPRRDVRVLGGYTLLGRQVDVIETSRGCTFDCSFCSIIEMRGRNFHTYSFERGGSAGPRRRPGSHLTRRWSEKDSNPRSLRRVQHFSRPPRNPARTNWPGSQNRILTIGKRRFIVRRARLAPAMISTPGHRASRRRQRGALPAWSLLAGRCPAVAHLAGRPCYVTSRSCGTHCCEAIPRSKRRPLATRALSESCGHTGRSARGGCPYRGRPRVRILLPPPASPLRTL